MSVAVPKFNKLAAFIYYFTLYPYHALLRLRLHVGSNKRASVVIVPNYLREENKKNVSSIVEIITTVLPE